MVHAGAVVGGPRFAGQTNVDPSRVTERPMASILDYPKLFDGIGLGLVPLRDTPFNYCKSAIKSMEYAASGVPFRSAYSPENLWFAPWAASHKANKPLRLEQLVDASRRAEEIEMGLERVAKEDIRVRWQEWEHVYASALSSIAPGDQLSA